MLGRLAEAVRPGGCLLIEEPDFHPVLASGSPRMRDFWQGWLAWAADHRHRLLRRAPDRRLLAERGSEEIGTHGETILFNGGSLPARYLEPDHEGA